MLLKVIPLKRKSFDGSMDGAGSSNNLHLWCLVAVGEHALGGEHLDGDTLDDALDVVDNFRGGLVRESHLLKKLHSRGHGFLLHLLVGWHFERFHLTNLDCTEACGCWQGYNGGLIALLDVGFERSNLRQLG